MSQSRRQSIIETVASTAIGFAVSLLAISIVLPAFGFDATHSDNFWITTIFTAISLVRGYFVRRMFNYLHRSRA